MQKITSRAIIGRYYQRLEALKGSSWSGQVAMVFNSDQASEEYAWLGMVPALREWIGGRQAVALREQGIVIRNRTFEATLRVSVDDIRRDKTGQIMVRVDELAERMAEHPASLLSQLINLGHAAPCYDGQFFFDTDHAEGESGVQDNDLARDIVAPSAPTPAEMEAAFMAAIQQLIGFKDDRGEPMNANARSFMAMVPINMLDATLRALNLPQIIDGGQARSGLQLGQPGNSGGFSVTAQTNPRLTDPAAFFLFRTDGQVKPFIQQEEMEQVSAVAEGSEHEFTNNEHMYGVKAIRNVGYGYWQHAVRVQFT